MEPTMIAVVIEASTVQHAEPVGFQKPGLQQNLTKEGCALQHERKEEREHLGGRTLRLDFLLCPKRAWAKGMMGLATLRPSILSQTYAAYLFRCIYLKMHIL